MHSVRRLRYSPVPSVSLLIGALVVLSGTTGFAAETNQFVFLIKNGKSFVTTVDKNGQEVSTSSGLLYPINDGAVVPESQGTARVTMWKRRVSDPFFKSLGSFAALIVFELDAPEGLRAHLTLIQTPTGLQTAIGIQPLEGSETPPDFGRSICGTWSVATALFAGQGPQDLVIAGKVSINTFAPAPAEAITLTKRAQQSFASDATPLTTHLAPAPAGGLSGVVAAMGSFYGQTTLGGPAVPARGFISNVAPASWAHLLAIATSPSDYAIVSCSATGVSAPIDATCLLSGIGPQAARLTGATSYTPMKNGTLLSVLPSYVRP